MNNETILLNGVEVVVEFSVDDDGDIEQLTRLEIGGVNATAFLDYEDISIAIEDALILKRVADKRLAEEDIAESRYYSRYYEEAYA